MSNYRTYIDEDGDEQEFTVFIIHGHSESWREVERYINKKLNLKTIVLKENYKPGETIVEKLEDAVYDDCDCAVAIMTPDDQTIDGKNRARQNVLYEIGYCQSAFGRDGVIILKEDSVEIHSDLHGLVFIGFKSDNIRSTFAELAEGLEAIYEYEDEDEE
jgi:predicted nucleotide-binding protein